MISNLNCFRATIILKAFRIFLLHQTTIYSCYSNKHFVSDFIYSSIGKMVTKFFFTTISEDLSSVFVFNVGKRLHNIYIKYYPFPQFYLWQKCKTTRTSGYRLRQKLILMSVDCIDPRKKERTTTKRRNIKLHVAL